VKKVSARKITLWVCYRVANDLGDARPTSHKCFARYFIFRAPTLRTAQRVRISAPVGKPFRPRKNFAKWNYLRNGCYYFSATHKNLTGLGVSRETRVSLQNLLSSLFSFFSPFYSVLYIDKRTLVVAGLTRHDFRETTKLSAFANVCKFVERISGLYYRSCDFY
jgi:hypothetical protein